MKMEGVNPLEDIDIDTAINCGILQVTNMKSLYVTTKKSSEILSFQSSNNMHMLYYFSLSKKKNSIGLMAVSSFTIQTN